MSRGSGRGNVVIDNEVPVTVSNFPATQSISGSIEVSNLPATQPVSGAVTVSNFPATQPVSGTVIANPYTYQISEGNVANHTPWSKIGYNGAIGATEEEMWPVSGVYVWPTEALTMTIVSDSAEDDADKTPAAGTGAYTVDVYYLTTGFVEKTVTVTMNGVSAVQIATDIYRFQNCRVKTAGTALAAVGNLTIAAGGTTYGYISAGRTRMRQCIWTVPIGKTLYITQIAFSCGDQAASKYARFTTKANYDNLAGVVLPRGLFLPYNEVVLNNTAYYRELNPPTKLPATVDLKVSCLANSAAVGTCALRGWIES